MNDISVPVSLCFLLNEARRERETLFFGDIGSYTQCYVSRFVPCNNNGERFTSLGEVARIVYPYFFLSFYRSCNTNDTLQWISLQNLTFCFLALITIASVMYEYR